ncbi:hypothetical protein [Candidatus Nitrosocosmicus arcticus]|uniref:hypothetical protein n=1 Tax=Candidatus Nitrosocosmicus arcticus TaxID=2035267 RepID=UPI0011A5F1E5|nr:hypothetical protein [Candidatus Nitrosocosmicus arcticus]
MSVHLISIFIRLSPHQIKFIVAYGYLVPHGFGRNPCNNIFILDIMNYGTYHPEGMTGIINVTDSI